MYVLLETLLSLGLVLSHLGSLLLYTFVKILFIHCISTTMLFLPIVFLNFLFSVFLQSLHSSYSSAHLLLCLLPLERASLSQHSLPLSIHFSPHLSNSFHSLPLLIIIHLSLYSIIFCVYSSCRSQT